MNEFWAALAGAIVGAAAAFGFEWWREAIKRKEDEYAAVTRTQLALVGQLVTIAVLREQFLNKYRNLPPEQRALKLTSFVMLDKNLKVNFDSLMFLIEKEDANLVFLIQNAEKSYLTAMEGLQYRNNVLEDLHAKSVLESLKEDGSCRIRVSDPRQVKLLVDVTNILYEMADKAHDRLKTQFEELRTIGKKRFPKRKFLALADAANLGK